MCHAPTVMRTVSPSARGREPATGCALTRTETSHSQAFYTPSSHRNPSGDRGQARGPNGGMGASRDNPLNPSDSGGSASHHRVSWSVRPKSFHKPKPPLPRPCGPGGPLRPPSPHGRRDEERGPPESIPTASHGWASQPFPSPSPGAVSPTGIRHYGLPP